MVKIEDTVTGKRYIFFEGEESMDWGKHLNQGESLSEKEEILTFDQLYGCLLLDTFVEIKDGEDKEIYNGEIGDMSEIVFNAIKGLDVLQVEPHPDFDEELRLLITVMR